MSQTSNKGTVYISRVAETDSTMNLLKAAPYATRDEAVVLVVADKQTQGRGQRGNTWESAPYQNLTFSLRVRPTWLDVQRQFVLSEATALSVRDTVVELLGASPTLSPAQRVTVKWPNDIYWTDQKLCGILIEHRLSGHRLSESIIGIGLNVNQQHFVSDAPNPISLRQISGETYDLDEVLDTFVRCFEGRYVELQARQEEGMHTAYLSSMYRRQGYYTFRDNVRNENITAAIADIALDGRLTLQLRDGTTRTYLFKEVTFL